MVVRMACDFTQSFRVEVPLYGAVVPDDGCLGQFLKGETEPGTDSLFRERLFQRLQQQGQSGTVPGGDVDTLSGDVRLLVDKVAFIHDLQGRDAFGTEVFQDLFRHPQVVFVFGR